MDLASSTNFMGLRDLSIAWSVRQGGCLVDDVLEMPREEVLADEGSILLREHLLTDPPIFVLDYLACRDALFPHSTLLFPTSDGLQYRPVKFFKRIKKLLEIANIPNSPSHPARLDEVQFQALLNLRFQLQRPLFQNALAVALCSHLGLRPSEVAKLVTTDLDFDNRLIILRQTKSQEDQEIPLLSFMVEPFKTYIGNLPRTAPLFINAQGLIWDRRDVTQAVSRWGRENGLEDLTTRKLRASLGAMLARLGVPPAMLAKILRHKDPATALRHYNLMEFEEIRRLLENVHSGNFRFDRRTMEDYQYWHSVLEFDE